MKHFFQIMIKNIHLKEVSFIPQSQSLNFIVRSIHERLIEDFDLQLGLADTSTHIVDGKEWPKVIDSRSCNWDWDFFEAVIELIHETMSSHWKQEGKGKSEIHNLWNEYVDRDLLPRLYGFELMMAPYSVAHLKITA